VGEILALEQERLAGHLGQGISKTIAEIQTRRMPASLAEIAVGFASKTGLKFRDGLNAYSATL
jgi:2-methylcitrate dehydratase PrpD